MTLPNFLIFQDEGRSENVWKLEGGFLVHTLDFSDKGNSFAGIWPKDATLKVAKVPKSYKPQLADRLPGDRSTLSVISTRLRDFLVEQGVGQNVEFLPITVHGLDDEVLSTDYVYMNPLGLVDCIDTDASEVIWNKIDPSLISSCKRLALREQAIEPERLVFRPVHLEHVILFRYELAKKMIDAGFSCLCFYNPEDYIGGGYHASPVFETIEWFEVDKAAAFLLLANGESAKAKRLFGQIHKKCIKRGHDPEKISKIVDELQQKYIDQDGPHSDVAKAIVAKLRV